MESPEMESLTNKFQRLSQYEPDARPLVLLSVQESMYQQYEELTRECNLHFERGMQRIGPVIDQLILNWLETTKGMKPDRSIFASKDETTPTRRIVHAALGKDPGPKTEFQLWDLVLQSNIQIEVWSASLLKVNDDIRNLGKCRLRQTYGTGRGRVIHVFRDVYGFCYPLKL